jgi:hypothetical protein
VKKPDQAAGGEEAPFARMNVPARPHHHKALRRAALLLTEELRCGKPSVSDLLRDILDDWVSRQVTSGTSVEERKNRPPRTRK